LVRSWLATGVLAGPQFRRFYLGRTISVFGSGMTPVALAFAVLAAPHGQQLLGDILAAEILPNVLMVLLGGSLADRYRRDRLIQLTNVGSGLSQAAIACLVLSAANPYWLLPFAIANGTLSAFTAPATRGIVPALVPPAGLQEANALLNTSRSAAKVVGPTVAGILVATLGGGWGIALDALSFFAAAACMAGVRIPDHPNRAARRALLHQLREGWDSFRQRRYIWLVTCAWAAINAVQMGVWRVLGPIIAERSFGAAGWGLALSVNAVGLLFGGVLMLRYPRRRPIRDGLIAGAALGLPLVALSQHHALAYLAAAALVAGMGATIARVTWDTALQQSVPPDRLSRVLAFGDVGSYVTIPFAVILAVPVADRLGLYPVALGAGIILILSALLPLLDQTVRTTTTEELHAMAHADAAPSRAAVP
jgi:MFS family permease